MVKSENSLCVWLKMGILWADLILLSFADQQRARSQETTDLLSLLGISPLSLLSSQFSMTSMKGRMPDFFVCGVHCPDSSLFWFTAGFYICFMPFKATWVPHMGSSPILSIRLPWLRCFVRGKEQIFSWFLTTFTVLALQMLLQVMKSLNKWSVKCFLGTDM